ncbi:MAG: S1C family serine protease [Nitrososphaerales archaeon]
MAVAVIIIISVASGYAYSSLIKGAAVQTTTQTLVATSYTSFPSNQNQSLDAVSIYSAANPSIVTVEGTTIVSQGQARGIEEVLGSGFVVLYQNLPYIVTNFHVVDNVSNMTVTFSDGNSYSANPIGKDPYSDLAIVKVQSAPASEFHPITIANSSLLQIGEPVVAIGNPFGLSSSITDGIISQLGRTLQEPAAGNFSIAGVVQFSAAINPGNSGGPLLNSRGQVVGITTASIVSSQGVGFAIPSNTILREMSSLITIGSYNNHPYMGIAGSDMNYFLAQAIGTNYTYGVLVETVAPNGPAANVLKPGTKQVFVQGVPYLIGGDIVVSINGTKIVSFDALASYNEQYALPGQTIILGIIRNGQLTNVSLVLGVRPPPP